MARSSLLIAAIHNGELPQAPARQLTDNLGDLTHQVIEVSEQQPFETEVNVTTLRGWRRAQSELEGRWAHYRERPASNLARALGRALFDINIKLSASARNNAWHVRQVEQAVTAKHIAAWGAFHTSNDQELLVLESDAVETDHTHGTLEDLLEHPADAPRYVNLAGGLDTGAIGITHLQDHTSAHNEHIRRYRKPVTNTSCAYLINRPFVELALQHLENSPEDAQLGIDWLFNSIFLDSAKVNSATIACWHAEPPVIVHGSLAGVTKSWHPNR